jgi:anti-sigma factor RsiW
MSQEDDPLDPLDPLSTLIRRHATRHAAPEALRAGLRTQIALSEAGRADPRPAAGGAGWRWPDLGWRSAAVGFALGLACAVWLPPLAQRLGPSGQPLAAEVLADHLRALQAGPLTEVASTDRHTVKPWFQGRLDYAPPVFDLGEQGFPLAGGRTGHLQGQRVAALAYRHKLHVIDVYVWPSSAQQAPQRSVRRGYNLVHWADGAMQVWAISDMDAGEIERFAGLWRERAAAN